LMTTMSVVGECFFWYRLTRVVPDKFHRAVKRLCVCVLSLTLGFSCTLLTSVLIGQPLAQSGVTLNFPP